jgi:hypothetical protein
MNDSPYTFFKQADIENIFYDNVRFESYRLYRYGYEIGFQNPVFDLDMNKNDDEYYWKIQ